MQYSFPRSQARRVHCCLLGGYLFCSGSIMGSGRLTKRYLGLIEICSDVVLRGLHDYSKNLYEQASQVLSCLVKDGDHICANDGSAGRVSPSAKLSYFLPSFCPKHAEALRSVSRPFWYGFVKVRPTRVRRPRSLVGLTRVHARVWGAKIRKCLISLPDRAARCAPIEPETPL